MHNVIAYVFKFLGLSLFLMLILNTSIVVFETINIHSRVNNLANVMQNEIIRNNGMPSDLVPLFNKQLDDLVKSSDVASGYITNMDRYITYKDARDSKSYISLDNTFNYGEMVTLYVGVNMSPSRVFFYNSKEDIQANKGSMMGKEVAGYTLRYEYTVPCLRRLR